MLDEQIPHFSLDEESTVFCRWLIRRYLFFGHRGRTLIHWMNRAKRVNFSFHWLNKAHFESLGNRVRDICLAKREYFFLQLLKKGACAFFGF